MPANRSRCIYLLTDKILE